MTKVFEIRVTNTDDDNDFATHTISASNEVNAQIILDELIEAYANA